MTNKFYLIILIFTTLFAGPVYADSSKITVEKIDIYLANLRTLDSEFIQTDSSGQERLGHVYIRKPNKIRIDYTTPEAELIILNKDLVMHYNYSLEEENYVSRDRLQLELLSKKNFRITKDTHIKRFEMRDNLIEVAFVMKNDPSKRLTKLQFAQEPLTLRTLSFEQEAEQVRIQFISPKINSSLPKKIFNFVQK